METLSADEVLSIHEALCKDFAVADDPISPPGLRSRDLLESAVSRQLTWFAGRMKYDTVPANAASLTYGICCNHPFHNGNKRTALVSMLCHMDKNDLTFNEDVSHSDLYNFMLKVAGHGFCDRPGVGDRSDIEVEAMTRWIRKRSRRIEKGERIITFRELKGILNSFGFELEDLRHNTVDVVRYEKKKTWLGLKTRTDRIRITRMGYPSDGQVVGKGQLREVRKLCRLTERDGVDSVTFYSKQRPTDYFVQNYRGLLRRLARV